MGNKKILYRSLSCISLIFVIAFGIIVIVASGGGGDGGTSNPNIEKCATPVFCLVRAVLFLINIFL